MRGSVILIHEVPVSRLVAWREWRVLTNMTQLSQVFKVQDGNLAFDLESVQRWGLFFTVRFFKLVAFDLSPSVTPLSQPDLTWHLIWNQFIPWQDPATTNSGCDKPAHSNITWKQVQDDGKGWIYKSNFLTFKINNLLKKMFSPLKFVLKADIWAYLWST